MFCGKASVYIDVSYVCGTVELQEQPSPLVVRIYEERSPVTVDALIVFRARVMERKLSDVMRKADLFILPLAYAETVRPAVGELPVVAK